MATPKAQPALLGLAAHGENRSLRHIVSARIEHKAILEPLEELARHGFEVTLVPPTSGGGVDPDAVSGAVRPDTLLVSVQPIAEIARVLDATEAYFHVDAAQAFGKAPSLRSRIWRWARVGGSTSPSPYNESDLQAAARGEES